MDSKREKALISFIFTLVPAMLILVVSLASFAQASQFGSALLVSSLFIGMIIILSSAFLYLNIFNHAWGVVALVFSIFSLLIGLAFVALPPGVIDTAVYGIPVYVSNQGSLAGIYGYLMSAAGILGIIGGAFGIARK